MRARGVLNPAFLAAASAAAVAHALWYTLFPIYLRSSAMELWLVGVISSLTMTLSFVLALPAGVAADAMLAACAALNLTAFLPLALLREERE